MSGPLDLTLPTATTKTGIPTFVPDTYVKLRFSKVSKSTVENKGDIILFEFDLIDPAPNEDGGTILPGQLGAKVFKRVYLYGKDGEEAAKLRATNDVSRILDGFLGTGDPDNKKGKPVRPAFGPDIVPSLIGQVTFAKFKKPDAEGRQDIAAFTFPGDVAGA